MMPRNPALAGDQAIDASSSKCARDRYAVTTVHDVIAIRPREQNNRGERVALAVRQRYPFPSVPH
jgi:hypothetical protein